MSRIKEILLLITFFIIIIVLIIFIPEVNNNYIKSKLYINEILASNYDTVLDNYNNYSDYIEIYNDTNSKINLNGYYLSDSEFDTKKWKFPDIEIDKKDYLVIYASGLDECSNNICHTNFKLSSNGEIITLSDKDGNIISKISYPKLPNDISYGYKNGKYVLLESPTPGKINNSLEYNDNKIKKYDIEINEYITKNTRVNYDNHGNYYDWVELYNKDSNDILLENVFISDDINDLKKYKLPKITIKKNNYLLLYFSKEKVNYEDNIYIPFSLSNNDKYLVLSDGVNIIDKVEIVDLKENISYGKVDGVFKYFTSPTPGYENRTASFDKVGDINGSS